LLRLDLVDADTIRGAKAAAIDVVAEQRSRTAGVVLAANEPRYYDEQLLPLALVTA
jgi:hypothetical protein